MAGASGGAAGAGAGTSMTGAPLDELSPPAPGIGSEAAVFLAAAFLAGAFGTAPPSALGFSGAEAGAGDLEASSASPYCFVNFISTGSSIVEEGDLTNSPISFSFSRTSLLSMP